MGEEPVLIVSPVDGGVAIGLYGGNQSCPAYRVATKPVPPCIRTAPKSEAFSLIDNGPKLSLISYT